MASGPRSGLCKDIAKNEIAVPWFDRPQYNDSTQSDMRPKILVFVGHYLPGFRSGGPARTLSCLIEALSAEFDFYVCTLNYDTGEKEPYTSVHSNAWNQVGSAKVYYVPRFTVAGIRRIVEELRPDLLYFNSFFSSVTIQGLIARRTAQLSGIRTVLATRGEMAPAALRIKRWKKRSYMLIANLFGIYKGVAWQASSDREKVDIIRELSSFGVREEGVHVASDLGFGYQASTASTPPKVEGSAHFVTLSRIVPMKNLPYSLDRMAELNGRVTLDIFGPVEDQQVWRECEQKISTLPENVCVRFLGPLEPARVLGELGQRQFFILPTLGENYGHVIIEGAAAGCPIIISDRTQWLDLQRAGVGWDISLEDRAMWNSVLQRCVDMGEMEYRKMSTEAMIFANQVMGSEANLKANFALFRQLTVTSDPQCLDGQMANIEGAPGAIR